MALKRVQADPEIQLPKIIDELNLINGKLFNLKMGTQKLIEAINDGRTTEELKHIVSVFSLTDVIKSLETKF